MPRLEKIRPASSKSVAQSLGDVAGTVQYSGQTEGDAGEIAFGGPTADFILYGVVNGAFAQGPADPDNDIDPQNNPLPYWNGPTQVSGGSWTVKWVTNSAYPSGYGLRFTANGVISDECYMEQIVPVGGDGGRAVGNAVRAAFVQVAGSPNCTVALQYLTAAGATTGNATSITQAPFLVSLVQAHADTDAAPPADAIFLRIRVGVSLPSTDSYTVDLASVRNDGSRIRLLLADQAGTGTYSPGVIEQSFGQMSLRANGSDDQVTIGGGALAITTALSVTSSATVGAAVIHSGVIAATISGNQNNYAPTGIATCSFIGFTVSGAARTITGWDATGFTEGQTFSISTSGGNDLVFDHASASSTSGNRIASANSASLTIRSGGGCTFIYVPSYSAANPFRIIAANA